VYAPAAAADGTIPAYDIFEGATRGISYPEPPSDCTDEAKTYVHLSIIPKKAFTQKKLKLNLKNIPFADKSVITMITPSMPTQIG
jgi:hypothetical protein